MSIRESRLLRAATGLTAAIGVGALVSATGASAATQPSQTGHFIQVANSSNISGDCTYINNGATNGLPGMLLFVTPNLAPGGFGGQVDNGAQVGVYYNTTKAQWCVFNEDGSTMQAGQAFNVLAVPPGGASAFQVTTTSSNSAGDYTLIDSAASNGQPNAILQATPVFTTGFENHIIGVWYESAAAKWGVFNEDKASMDSSDVFNVLVGTSESGGGKAAVLTSNSTNTGGNSVHINSPVTNGDPNAFVMETPSYNPGGKGGSYNNIATGVWYVIPQMVVFNENNANMATGKHFNVLMFNS